MGGFLGGLIRAGVAGAAGAAQGDVEGAKLKQQLALQALAQKAQEQQQQIGRATGAYDGVTFGDDGTVTGYDPEHSRRAAYEQVIAERTRTAQQAEEDRKFAQQTALERMRLGGQMAVARIGQEGKGPAGGQPSDGERKAGAQVEGARSSAALLDKYTDAPPAAQGLGKVPGLGNYLLSPEQQKLEAAGRALAEQYLRPFSGASISQNEIDNLAKQTVPRPGDSPELLQYKASRRQEIVRAIESAAGRAAPPPAAHPSEQPASAPAGGSDRAGMIREWAAQGMNPAQIKARLQALDATGRK